MGFSICSLRVCKNCAPVAPSTKVKNIVSSVELFALTVTVAGTISPVPSKDVPPMFLAVANAVAVSALPVTAPSIFATMVAVLESVTDVTVDAELDRTALNLSSPSFQ